jgi:hypothetical protein
VSVWRGTLTVYPNGVSENEVSPVAAYKVNVSLDPRLVDEIDETARELGLSRSGFIAEASARYVADVRNLSAEERVLQDRQRALATFRRVGPRMAPGFDGVGQIRRDRERDTPREGL